MRTVRAIFNKGVLSPIGRVEVPDGSEVLIETEEVSAEAEAESTSEIYRILGTSYPSGEHDVSERHNEHQP